MSSPASPLFRGASRVLRSSAAPARLQSRPVLSATRCVSTLNVERQQKVRHDASSPSTSSTLSSSPAAAAAPLSTASAAAAPANQSTATQLLASHLKEADPAMYEIIENVRIPFGIWSCMIGGNALLIILNWALTELLTYRRKNDRSTSSTSFLPRTSHHKRY